MAALTRADAITQTSKVLVTYTDFVDSFSKNPVNEELVLLKNEDSVRQALKNLIMTNPGERFFNPYFGTGISKSLFELFSSLIVQKITSNINVSAASFEPRVNILSVQVSADTDQETLGITVTFSLINMPEPITLTMFLDRVR